MIVTGRHINIAIDGPSGSGKSTLAKNLSKRYGLVYIDTGALYRTVGLAVCNAGISSGDRDGIIAALPGINITMSLEDGGSVVYLDGNKVGNEIRTDTASAYASDVSAIPEVRSFLLDIQRSIAADNDCVMDGRDIGTVILPDADVKIFLHAAEDDRAERRYAELLEKGQDVTLEAVKSGMTRRDANDKNRAESPAVPASDAVMLDNSGFEPEETLERASEIIESRVVIKRV